MVAPHHLAQLNVARLRAPIDDPLIAPFVDALDRVNALADRSPGFVWRLQDDSGNATSISAFDDPDIILNLSVWESIDALHTFVYRGDHLGIMRRRRDWFHPSDTPYVVLWWLAAGHRPTIDEAVERLDRLQRCGPTPAAFTFRDRFDPA